VDRAPQTDAGGITIVQDPADALHPGMPRSVLELMEVDRVLAASEIPKALVELAGKQIPEETRQKPDAAKGA